VSVTEIVADAPVELYRRHHEALCRYLLRFTGDPELAQDLAQEVFVRLLERPPARGAGRAWLFHVATNLARDASRTRTRRRALLLGGWNRVPVADAPPTPAQELDRQRRVQATQQALLSISAKERTALLMREEGFSHREIAEAVGTTTGSVGTLIARAIRKVAARLGPALEES
jgi:RNA polymerase sigma factor (sigma-70 family)